MYGKNKFSLTVLVKVENLGRTEQLKGTQAKL